MNDKPIIWKWDAQSGILTITYEGDGYVLLEIDDTIFEAGEDKATYSFKSAVGNSHQARACNSKNGSIVSEWAESTFLVPATGDSSESGPDYDEELSQEDDPEPDNSDDSSGEQSSTSSKYIEVKSLLERALVSLILQKPASEFFNEEGNNLTSSKEDEKNMSSLDD